MFDGATTVREFIYGFFIEENRRPYLFQKSDENLYGTSGGTVFKVTIEGNVKNPLSFNGSNDWSPFCRVQGTDGTFYGLTLPDTTDSAGSLCKKTLAGGLSLVKAFNRSGQGSPTTRLIRGSDGNLYGTIGSSWRTTTYGTAAGAFFRLVQPPVVEEIPQTNGKVILSWNSFPRGIYRVEYKPTLAATNWTILNSEVTATGYTTSMTDNRDGVTERYYRVRLLP